MLQKKKRLVTVNIFDLLCDNHHENRSGCFQNIQLFMYETNGDLNSEYQRIDNKSCLN